MKYKFQCDACGNTAEGEDRTQTVLDLKHDDKCPFQIGAPVHYKCLFDWQLPNLHD